MNVQWVIGLAVASNVWLANDPLLSRIQSSHQVMHREQFVTHQATILDSISHQRQKCANFVSLRRLRELYASSICHASSINPYHASLPCSPLRFVAAHLSWLHFQACTRLLGRLNLLIKAFRLERGFQGLPNQFRSSWQRLGHAQRHQDCLQL